MQRLLHTLSLALLPLLLVLSVAVAISSGGAAQTTASCGGNNMCEPFIDRGSETQCVTLYCTQSYNSSLCRIQKCAAIPSTCGAGSYYDGDMTCALNKQSASTSYYCASTDKSVLKVYTGPQCTPSPTPTPPRRLAPEAKPKGFA